MDVKFEGKSVCRHLDITTSNHGSQPGATPPVPNTENMSLAQEQGIKDEPRCPCCGNPAHSNQVDSNGELLPTIKEEEYYSMNAKVFTDRRDEMRRILASGKTPPWAFAPGKDKNPSYNGLPVHEIITTKGDEFERTLNRLRTLRTDGKNCPNVHEPPDTGCGTHFDPRGETEKARESFEKKRMTYLKNYRRAHPDRGLSQSAQVNHKTPLDAGGCPISEGNLIPDPVLTGSCKEIEELQTRLQGQARNSRMSTP